MITKLYQRDAAHRDVVLLVAHLAEGLVVAVWLEHTVPLEAVVYPRRGDDLACDLTAKEVNTSTIDIADVRDRLCSAVLWLVHAERESEASSARRRREFSMPSAERYGRPSGVPCEL